MSPKKSVKKPPEIETLEKDFSHEGKVIIKYQAYLTMISHVLRFGNEALEKSVEVLGVCMGKIADNGNDLICYEAVPISHGSGVDVGFTQEDYIAFASVDEQYSEKGLFAIGWYHSHPGLGVFFSDIDIKNHLFWQKEQTPMAFGLVFDHILMGVEDSLGFKAFRLDDYRLGPGSDFHEVMVEIEPPKSLDFYKVVKRLVEESQKKTPIIQEEINEMVELQEIPKPEEGEILEEIPESPLKPTLDGFLKGTAEFSETFLTSFQNQLNAWTQDIAAGTTKGSAIMAKTISTMQEAISVGMTKIKNWFEKTLSNQMNEFKDSINEQVGKRLNLEKELISELNQKIDAIVNDVLEAIDTTIVQNFNETGEKIKESIKLYDDMDKIQESTKSKIDEQAELVKNVVDGIETISTKISNDLNSISSDANSLLSEELKKVTMEISSIKSQNEKMSSLMDKLQKLVMDLRKQ